MITESAALLVALGAIVLSALSLGLNVAKVLERRRQRRAQEAYRVKEAARGQVPDSGPHRGWLERLKPPTSAPAAVPRPPNLGPCEIDPDWAHHQRQFATAGVDVLAPKPHPPPPPPTSNPGPGQDYEA